MVVEVEETKSFARFMSKTKDRDLKSKVKTQVKKIVDNPEIGKPMKYSRKGKQSCSFECLSQR